MLTVLLVRPRPSPETIGLQHVMIVEPLELEVLGALTPPHQPIIVDMILERKPIGYFLSKFNPDVVCVTGYITHVQTIIEYCTAAKAYNPRTTTVVGGVHCEVCPEDLDHPSIDYRVVRNATTSFNALLECIDKATELPNGILRQRQSIDEIPLPDFDFRYPFPDRSLTAKYRSQYFYIFHDKVALLKTSFGCPHRCKFCFCRAITRGKFSTRPIGEVIQELSSIREKDVYIVDDDFLAGKERLEGFISAVREHGIRKIYLVYGRADFIASNPEIMKRFKEVGLKTIIVGFESFFDDELAQYDKGNDSATNKEAMRILKSLDIDCYATIIAPPDWDRKRFDQCASTLKSLGIHYVNIQPLTPLPGTGMTIHREHILIRREDYPQWDLAHVTIRPLHMTVAEFYRRMLAVYDAVLFQPRVLLRYIRQYRLRQLWKMAHGSYRVRRQYEKKIRDALRNEAGVQCPKSS